MRDVAWEPLSVEEVDSIFSPFDAPWWIAGGHAIELAVGRTIRSHDDVDVLILRKDQEQVREFLANWECYVADPPGMLRPWPAGETLAVGAHDVWCRQGGPWLMQLMFDDSSGDEWVSRRSERVRRPIASVGLSSDTGVPYVAPAIQLFYKAQMPRPKDEADLAAALPLLGIDERSWLAGAIAEVYGGSHQWLPRLTTDHR